MMRVAFALSVVLAIVSAATAEENLALSYLGYNGYPSDGKIPFRIDIFAFPNGIISRVAAFDGQPLQKSEEAIITLSPDSVHGRDQFDAYIKTFELRKVDKNTFEFVSVGIDQETDEKRTTNNTIRIAPTKSILFEDDERVFLLNSRNELNIIDSKSKEILYAFIGNRISSEGYYKADWKTRGNKTSIAKYLTMEKYGEWIDAGKGVFTGGSMKSDDASINVINYCIMNLVYPNIPDFIPFIFGLKTGSY